MRNKSLVGDNKMIVTDYKSPAFVGASARSMSRALLEHEFRGPGDTLESAAHRLETKFGVESSVILQGWRRDIPDMMASRWIALLGAYYASGLAKIETAYSSERALHADASALVRLADLVAGPQGTGVQK